ncbi:MAG: preprotein translocase subunit SecY [bacterium]
MFQAFSNIFKISDLRKKIIYTLLLMVVYRIGSHIPTAGINSSVLGDFFAQQKGNLLGLFDLFSGRSLRRLTIFALGIMPYISSSIIFQLLTVVVPYLEKLSKEGAEGKKKIARYTRYGTILLSIVQSYGISLWLENPQNFSGHVVVPDPGLSFRLMTVLTLTTGTSFLMWLGERISELGIGNGISLIIFFGIVCEMPEDLGRTINALSTGRLSVFFLILIIAIMVLTSAAVIAITQGMRKIPVQYAKRVVGRKIYGGQSSFIPLRINTAGVIPVIFASSILMFPATVAQFVKIGFVKKIADFVSPGTPYSLFSLFPAYLKETIICKIFQVFTLYNVFYAGLIVFFSFFYTSVIFNPTDVSDNMRKYGGFIPGLRPGKQTADFIESVLSKITFMGGIYLALIAILPDVLISTFNAPFWFGGTSLLIVIGVALDTVQQIETHLISRSYEGFMKKGTIKGRRGF